ncbi:DNA methyltransferase [Burkholderia ubonensis]|uniref:DNA methyltransferase n=1 Tax=Burkholderia ubonensis TaxID=101571 RepID=UPI0007578252|nr:DNA methyltransferase [Burkholderia ubonensis]KWK86667.1 hypothetical protein WM17_06400 [Burkholderia ubonensis]KWK92543.1 hypothetical protein WM18_18940 [Burkholderia ubonensis]KWO20797.1 hypothetical protein WM25_10935 [Burkholderia ubonensis]
MRAIRATGDYQAFQDTELRGFGVKVTPAGSATYTYRWTKPDGTQGRKTIGRWPDMNPAEARDTAKQETALTGHKGETLAVASVRKSKRTEVAGGAPVVLPGFCECAPERNRVHVTQKPLELMRELLRIVPAGARVLDPFMGSGSTDVAAIQTGRAFVGIELDPKHFATACERIGDASHTQAALGI